MNIMKVITVFALNLLISVPTYATVVEQKKFNFLPDTKALLKGDVHVSTVISSPKTIYAKYPELFDLDSFHFTHEPDIKLAVSKAAYIVNKPAGFFGQDNLGQEKFLKQIMGEQKLEKIDENQFKVVVPGQKGHSYVMKMYFDSDDISTLPNSRVIRAVTQARRMDVISGSASLTAFTELNKFSKYGVGGVRVTSYIALKENKTLIITYSLSGIKKRFAKTKLLKQNFKDEVQFQKQAINDFE